MELGGCQTRSETGHNCIARLCKHLSFNEFRRVGVGDAGDRSLHMGKQHTC
jgi:hypothetical protein